MSNDRLFIACDVCGATLRLAKWYPSSGFMCLDRLEESLKTFLDRHFGCRQDGIANDLGGRAGFYFKVESEPDFIYSETTNAQP